MTRLKRERSGKPGTSRIVSAPIDACLPGAPFRLLVVDPSRPVPLVGERPVLLVGLTSVDDHENKQNGGHANRDDCRERRGQQHQEQEEQEQGAGDQEGHGKSSRGTRHTVGWAKITAAALATSLDVSRRTTVPHRTASPI